MQAIGAYLIFLLAVVALGLSVICAGALSIAIYEGGSWLSSRLYPRAIARVAAHSASRSA